MAGTGDGFRATVGVILAIVFMCIIVPTLAMMLFCGGCVFVGSNAVEQARVAAEKARASEDARIVREQNAAIAAGQVPNKVQPEQPVVAVAADLPVGEEMPEKVEEPAKAEPKFKDEPIPEKAVESVAPREDPAARRALDLAVKLMDKSPDAAKKRLRELIKKYPETEAAKEAQAVLDK